MLGMRGSQLIKYIAIFLSSFLYYSRIGFIFYSFIRIKVSCSYYFGIGFMFPTSIRIRFPIAIIILLLQRVLDE